jgi:hypothetical protein
VLISFPKSGNKYGRYGGKKYCKPLNYGFDFPLFSRNSESEYNFFDRHGLYGILFKINKNVENRAKFPSLFQVKQGFHPIDYHETEGCSLTWRGTLLLPASTDPAKKERKYEYKLFYALTCRTNLEQIFTKLAVSCVKILTLNSMKIQQTGGQTDEKMGGQMWSPHKEFFFYFITKP